MNKIDSQHLDVENLENISKAFFQMFGTRKLLGRQFFVDLETGSETNLFEKLLAGCGYANNANGFFQALVSRIGLRSGKGIILNLAQELQLVLLTRVPIRQFPMSIGFNKT